MSDEVKPKTALFQKIAEKYRAEVLAAVAAVPQEDIDRESYPRGLARDIFKHPDVYRHHEIFFVRAADTKTVLQFTLRGDDLGVFAEHAEELLGTAWKVEGASVSIALTESNKDDEIEAEVKQHEATLDHAFTVLQQHYERVGQELQRIANASFWRMVSANRVMKKLKIKPKG